MQRALMRLEAKGHQAASHHLRLERGWERSPPDRHRGPALGLQKRARCTYLGPCRVLSGVVL